MAWVRVALAAVAAGLAVAARLPALPAWTIAAAAAATVLVAGSLLAALKPASRLPRGAVIVGAVGLLAVPQPPHAVLALPAALGAFAVLAALHANLPSAGDTPARRGSTRLRQAVVRTSPVLALLAVVAVLPWLAQQALPGRIAHLQEWDTPVGPLAVGAFAVLVLVALASVHALLARRTVEPEDETADGGLP